MKTDKKSIDRALSVPLNCPTNVRKKLELYIDAEWFISQKMYLLGYAYDLRHRGQLYGAALNAGNVRKLLRNVETIYFWGPDIGMLEKCFGLSIRGRIRCVNLLKVMHYIEPCARSYKLSAFEKKAGIVRQTMEYKSNIWTLHRDWRDPRKRARAMLYNMEDVLNMLRVKRFFWKKHGITREHEEMFAMR